MLFELPAETSVRFFRGGVTLRVLVRAVLAAGVGTVRFVQGLGLLPFVALARNRAEEKSGGGGGEERGRFHPAAGCSGSAADGKRRSGAAGPAD